MPFNVHLFMKFLSHHFTTWNNGVFRRKTLVLLSIVSQKFNSQKTLQPVLNWITICTWRKR